jgi:rubrerythrin
MELKDSKTYQNLLTAYKSELEASTRFLIYGDIARSEGYIEIGNIYDVVARNDKEHARIWFRRLNGGTLPNTLETLQDADAQEYASANIMYQDFANVAREEGFDDLAALFSGVANIDFNHSYEFRAQADNIQNDEVFCKPTVELWICMQCGNIMSSPCAPAICPVCGFPQGYYRLFNTESNIT